MTYVVMLYYDNNIVKEQKSMHTTFTGFIKERRLGLDLTLRNLQKHGS